MSFSDSHFNNDRLSGSYNYFGYRAPVDQPTTMYDRVMDLCEHVVLCDPMGSDKRVFDIYGYTPQDILQMDLTSFNDLHTRLIALETEHNKTKADLVAGLGKGTPNVRT